jgi:hypothetical protein
MESVIAEFSGRNLCTTTLVKEGFDRLCNAMAFNIKRSYRVGGQKDDSYSCNLGTGLSEAWVSLQERGEE